MAMRGDEGVGIAAAGAVVLGRAEHNVLRAYEDKRHRQAETRKRLRHRHDVRAHPHLFEGEKDAGAANAGLDIVDDEARAVLFGNPGDAPELSLSIAWRKSALSAPPGR